MTGLAGSAWQLYKRNFGSIVGPLWLVNALLIALARAYFYASPTSHLAGLLLIDLVLPVFALSVAVAVVSVRIAAIDSGDAQSLAQAWSRLGPHRGRIAFVALIPTAFTLVVSWPTETRLLVLLLFNGILGPPLVMQATVLEGLEIRASLSRARILLSGRGARTVLYLVNVVVGTGVLGLVVGGALAYATIGTGGLELISLPVQTLLTAALLGYVVAFEYVLFKHLVGVHAAATQD